MSPESLRLLKQGYRGISKVPECQLPPRLLALKRKARRTLLKHGLLAQPQPVRPELRLILGGALTGGGK